VRYESGTQLRAVKSNVRGVVFLAGSAPSCDRKMIARVDGMAMVSRIEIVYDEEFNG
jgi:hypothetical protein